MGQHFAFFFFMQIKSGRFYISYVSARQRDLDFYKCALKMLSRIINDGLGVKVEKKKKRKNIKTNPIRF